MGKKVAVKVEDVGIRFNLSKEKVDTLKEYAIKFLKREIKYDELGEYFSENRVKFDYSKILSSKYENEQVTLFDTNNLFAFASKINCKLLGREF